MCGIFGIIFKNNCKYEDIEQYLINLQENLKNRGPDCKGYYIENKIGIGHNRLSIIDSNEDSNQPFYFKNFIMSFNGEIYNHIDIRKKLSDKYNAEFKTDSDTETLIQSFYYLGLNDTLNIINGMFLIVLFNKETKEIILIRDRIGEKMCYYYKTNDYFIFASNPGTIVKTLFKLKKQKFNVNIKILFSYLSSGFCSTNKTLFEGIQGINCGSLIKMNNYSFEEIKWWNPTFNYNNDLSNNIIKAIQSRQTKNDNDSYISFSGGIDSSVISNYTSNISHLTIDVGELDNTISVLKSLNKLDLLEEVDDNFVDTIIDDFINEHRKIINFSGFPTSASYLMLILGKYIKTNSNKRVLISGIGGNELFYGYRRMKLNNLSLNDHIRDIFHYHSQIEPHDKYKEIFDNFNSNLENDIKKDINIPDNLNPLNHPRWLELNTILLNNYLLNADSIFMYYSIECRTPYLDYNLIESALSLNPEEFFYNIEKIKKSPSWYEYIINGKKPLKELLKQKLKKEDIFREKFDINVERHIIGPMYFKLCDEFMKRNIVKWKSDFTKFNAPLIGSLELWFQEFDELLIIK